MLEEQQSGEDERDGWLELSRGSERGGREENRETEGEVEGRQADDSVAEAF